MPREEFDKALKELQISINAVEKTVKKMINGSIDALNTEILICLIRLLIWMIL